MPPANALLGGAAGGGEGGGGTGEDSFVAAVLRVANTVYEIRSGHVASHSSNGDDESDSEGLHESKQRSKSIGLLVWTLLQVSVAVLRDVFVLLLLLLVGVVVLTYRYGDRQHWAWFHEHPVTWAAVALFGVEAAFRLYTKVKILHVQVPVLVSFSCCLNSTCLENGKSTDDEPAGEDGTVPAMPLFHRRQRVRSLLFAVVQGNLFFFPFFPCARRVKPFYKLECAFPRNPPCKCGTMVCMGLF